MISRVRNQEVNAVIKFASGVFIPALKGLISGKIQPPDFLKEPVTMSVNSCKQCENSFENQDSLRTHIDASHVGEDRIPKRMRSVSASSISRSTSVDEDIIVKLTSTIKILNDKRDQFQEKIKLDAEVIDKLGCKIFDLTDKVKKVSMENLRLQDAVKMKEAELLRMKDEAASIKKETDDIVAALIEENLSLKKDSECIKDAEKPDPMDVEETNELEQLVFLANLRMNKSGTVLPPSETNKCNVCNLVVDNKQKLSTHMKNHNDVGEDGDWTCTFCSFQTNRNEHLLQHTKTAHTPISCDYCKKTFETTRELETHILNNHKNFKPCRNFFEPNGTCKFELSCHFSHVQVPDNKQRCFKCGSEFNSVGDLMVHRKTEHMEKCREGLVGKCRFSQETCYLNHPMVTPPSLDFQLIWRIFVLSPNLDSLRTSPPRLQTSSGTFSSKYPSSSKVSWRLPDNPK